MKFEPSERVKKLLKKLESEGKIKSVYKTEYDYWYNNTYQYVAPLPAGFPLPGKPQGTPVQATQQPQDANHWTGASADPNADNDVKPGQPT
jgi:hypothetical protein